MGDTGRHQPDRSRPAVAASVDDLLLLAATLLFVDGQTTQRTIEATERLAVALGVRARLLPRWGELTLCIDDAAGARVNTVAATGARVKTVGAAGTRVNTVAADPVGVDMGKVVATTAVLEQLCDGRIDQETAVPALQAIKAGPPVSLAHFALLAAAGAAALGVIFGATHWLSLVLIALSAGVGGCLRRFLAGLSHNPFIQPFCAALLAGVVGAVAARLQLSSLQLLVAVCPCMVLVPGPHLLNGAIDLGRARIALGAARMGYAFLVIAMICSGLLLGLALGGTSLPVSGPSHPAPLLYDVAAAGVAVAAYGTFFAMPWRMLPVPILIGMLAHAARWVMIALCGGSVEAGAFVACLLVGSIVTPVADRMRLPFAGFAFASVVSLMPGVFLFRMGGGLLQIATLGAAASPALLLDAVADGTTAVLIILAMTFGLIFPKLLIERFLADRLGPVRE